ncbi:MAG: hypothetical protein ACOC30_01585 [Marinilabilia sp.]
MVKNILKVDPVAFRYEDPDFIEGPGAHGDDDDFEWSDEDFDGDEFEFGEYDGSSMDLDTDPVWGDDDFPADEDL